MKWCCYLLALVALMSAGVQAETLRVITHSSFELPKPLLSQFEQQSGVKLSLIQAGDAAAMLNKLILTRQAPIADVVFGLDNSLVSQAQSAGVLAPLTLPATKAHARYELPAGLASVDYGYVTLIYDKAWFARHALPLPKSLADLTTPAYRNLLVVENPATSSPGQAFLLATIQGLGVESAFAFWNRLRQNGVKVTNDWSSAFNTEFTLNGGGRPIVVSYATDPAAEVYFSKKKLSVSPVGILALPGAVYRQVEGVGLIKGGQSRAAAEKFIQFLRSRPVQQALQTTMWMYPVMPDTPLAPVFAYAHEPARQYTPSPEQIQQQGPGWVQRWTRVVLK